MLKAQNYNKFFTEWCACYLRHYFNCADWLMSNELRPSYERELTKTLKESVMTYLSMLIMWTDLEKLWKASIITVCNPWIKVNTVMPDSWPETFTQDLEDSWENGNMVSYDFNLNQMKKCVAWSNSLQNDKQNNSTALAHTSSTRCGYGRGYWFISCLE